MLLVIGWLVVDSLLNETSMYQHNSYTRLVVNLSCYFYLTTVNNVWKLRISVTDFLALSKPSRPHNSLIFFSLAILLLIYSAFSLFAQTNCFVMFSLT